MYDFHVISNGTILARTIGIGNILPGPAYEGSRLSFELLVDLSGKI